MKNILFMRHAKSSWDNPRLADHDRPLKKRGVSASRKIGEFLTDIDLVPDVIMSSTSKRTRETIKYFLQSCPFEGEIYYTRFLYHGGQEDMIDAVKEFAGDNNCVLVVGHNPGMEDAVEAFTGQYERMPTAAVAHVVFSIGTWPELNESVSGDLQNIWRPKELSN